MVKIIAEHERHVASIIEQTLLAFTHTDLTVEEIIEAAHQNAMRQSAEATAQQ